MAQIQVVRKGDKEYIVLEKETYIQLISLIDRVLKLSRRLEEIFGDEEEEEWEEEEEEW